MRERAREVLTTEAFGYVDGSPARSGPPTPTGAPSTAGAPPRMLRDVDERDLSVELFGRTLPAPLLLAPIGVQGIVHQEAEVATARAAATLGIPTSCPPCPRTPWRRSPRRPATGPELVPAVLADRERSGRQPHPAGGRRRLRGGGGHPRHPHAGLAAAGPHTAYLPFLHGKGLANYRTDPVFNAGLDENAEDPEQAAIMRWVSIFADPSQTPATSLKELTERSPIPVLVKGIQHPDDARLAIDAGVAGLVVSNHGGRQVDNAIGSLETLPGVVDEVGGEVPVLFDSGVRTGADIAVAVALGADAALLGRPYVWGLAVDGEEGVRHVLRCLLADFELTVALSGATTCAELTRDLLVREPL
jgi:lactate 2-monooxygenase